MRAKRFWLVALVLLVRSTTILAEPPRYKLKVLDVSPERAVAKTSLADRRVVTGYLEPDNGLAYQGFLIRSHQTHFLSPLQNHEGSIVSAVNAGGVVAGHSVYFDDKIHWSATVWRPPLYQPELFPVWNNGDSKIKAINKAGELVGGANIRLYHNRQEWHAFKWSGSELTDLGTLGGQRSEAQDINDCGNVVGGSDTKEGYQHAFWYRSGIEGLIDLGSFANPYHYSLATGLNDSDQVVGWSVAFDATPHAFFWSEEIGLHDLTGGSALLQSGASAINNQNQIVGWIRNGWGEESQAALWDSGYLYRLADWLINNQNDFVLVVADDVNDRGQIVGRGNYNNKTVTHLFFLSPVEE